MREIVFATLFVLGACTEHGKSPGDGGNDPRMDALVIGPPDAANFCGNQILLSGEMVDINSTANAFAPVAGAHMMPPASTTVVATTQPNGQFEACIPNAAPFALSFDAPDDYLDGTITIDPNARFSLHGLSLRTIKASRIATFYTSLGLTFDANKAQLLVFQAGDRIDVSIDRSHGTAQSASDDNSPGTFTWSAGVTGRYVLFPNVDTAQGTATVNYGGLTIPATLAPGQLSIVAVAIVFI